MEAILEKLKVRNFPSTKYKDGIRIQLPIQDVRKEREIDRNVVLDRIQRQTLRGRVETATQMEEDLNADVRRTVALGDDAGEPTPSVRTASEPSKPIESDVPVPKTKKITKIVLEVPEQAKVVEVVEEKEIEEKEIGEKEIGEKEESEVPIGEKEVEVPKTVMIKRPATRKIPPTTTMIAQPPPEILTMKTSPYYLNNRKLFLQKINQLFAPYMKELADTEEEITCGKLKAMGAAGDKFQLLLHQRVVREYLNLLSPYRGLLLYHGLGAGKCHKKDTPIMLHDGTIKMVQDIQVGEFLMGDDSTPRTVTSLARGRDKMYDIIPVKGEKYTVNEEHILCLQYSGYPRLCKNGHVNVHNYSVLWIEDNRIHSKSFIFNPDHSNQESQRILAETFFQEEILNDKIRSKNIIEISVKDYLKLPKSNKASLKGYKVPIEFPEQELPFDPYMIGYWIGDGSSRGSLITTQDSTVLHYFANNLPKYNLHLVYRSSYSYGITGNGKMKGKTNNNHFLNTLQELNLIQNKHIPHIYKCNSRENRLKLLAGLIDSDGCYDKIKSGFEFTQKNETIMDDVVFLARSLGFSCYKKQKKTSWTYKGVKNEGVTWRICINGAGLDEIPTNIPRKRASPRKQIKDVLVSGITVEYVNEDDYYGFTIDGNCRYVMGDFTVTHNTAASIGVAEGMKSHKKVILLTPASLKMNFFSELKRAGDPLYKKNQHWAFVSTEGRPDLQESLARSMSLSMEFIQKNRGVWVAEANKPANFADITDDQQTQVDDQLNQMIRAKYTDIHYNAPNLRKIIAEMSQNYTKNPFDNAVIIIDEAHNLVNRIVNKLSKMPKKAQPLSEKTPVSIVLYEYLMSASNARVVLLSGTPIINTPSEVGVLYNMLRGYIKTWTYSVHVTTNQKVTTDTIRNMFHKENFETLDFMEYSQNKLTITRNPYGFVNNTTGVCMPKKQPKKVVISRPKNVTAKVSTNVKTKAKVTSVTGGSSSRKTKKNRTSNTNIEEENDEGFVDEEEEIDDTDNLKRKYVVPTYLQHTGEDEPHMGGSNGGAIGYVGGDDSVDPRYKGVCLDETGNVSDKDFAFKVRDILNKNGLEVVGSPQIDLNKCLPDKTDAFLDMFVDIDTGNMKNPDLFVRRILGLTSFFKSAQETLLPSFVKTADGEVYNVVHCDMSQHQFDDYASIRKEEYEKEKDMQKQKKKRGPAPAGQGEGEELYKDFTSTYRIYSRAACNFSWPQPPDRPIQPLGKGKGKNAKDVVEAVATESSLIVEGGKGEGEGEEVEIEDLGDEVNVDDMASAQDNPDIATAMETLNDPKFLAEANLGSYSPKFAAILERIVDDKNVGLHLLYSSFRTLEGIGILRLILLQNGFAEFKLVKTTDGEWDIDEGEEGVDAGKPRFALYTGTETAEEKEIIRNVYNGAWDMIPPNIAKKLEERDPDGKKNVMGAVIKVLMITASGAEGINLKNTRYVHIVEPYWNMVRVDQVVGRARRICSHEELPPELRTVEVFIYLSVFSEKQKTDRNYIDLMNQDTSRFDESVPVTTDETLYEISLQKNRINQRILEVVKQSSVDCALYNPTGKNQVCYGANLKNVTTNDFISYPSIDLDAQVKERTVVQRTQVTYRDVTMKGEKYHLNEATQEIYDHPTYMRAKKSGETMVPLGKLVKEGRGYKIVKE